MSLIGIAVFALWLWCLYDCARTQIAETGTKILWLLVIFFLPLIGSLAWLCFGKG